MYQTTFRLLIFAVVCALLSTGMPKWVAAEPEASDEGGIYMEDFTTDAARGFSRDIDWNTALRSLQLSRSSDRVDKSPVLRSGGGKNYGFFLDAKAARYVLLLLDDSGNSLWPRPVTFAESECQGTPELTVDRLGDAIVICGSYQNGIYAHRLDSAGNMRWAQGVRVDGCSGESCSFYGWTAASGEHGTLVAWADGRSGHTQIFVQQIDAQGNRRWVDDKLVTADHTQEQQADAAVAVGNNDSVYVAWLSTAENCIYMQLLDRDGRRAWANDLWVSNAQGWEIPPSRGPRMITTPQGHAIVAWIAGLQVRAQRFDDQGNRLWPSDATAGSITWSWPPWSTNMFMPKFAIGYGNGLVTLAWEDGRRDNPDIYGQQVDLDGRVLWQQAQRINSGNEVGSQTKPTVAMTDSGSATIAWEELRDGFSGIEFQGLSRDGRKRWPVDGQLAADTPTGAALQTAPQIGVTSSGQVIAVWTDNRGDGQDIYAQQFTPEGSAVWQADVQVNDVVLGARQNSARIAIDARNNTYIVWLDSRLGYPCIYVQGIDVYGNRLWGQDLRVDVSPPHAELRDPSITVDAQGNPSVVWHDWDFFGEVAGWYVQRISAAGQRLWEQPVLVTGGEKLAVATNSRGETLLVWQSEYEGVYAQKLNSAGARVWSEDIRVDTQGNTGVRDAPVVTLDSNDTAMIIWGRCDSTSHECALFAQRLDTGGNRAWETELPVGGFDGSANVAAVTLRSGETVVGWRGAADRIFAQRLNRSGVRMWPEARVVAIAADGGYADHPTVTYDPNGNAVLAWEEGKILSSQAFPTVWADAKMQKLTPSGEKIWPSALSVAYPDRFYATQGLIQSRAIDTVAESVSSASLTGHYLINGGAVVFSLTNNGGADWFPVTPGVTHVFTTTGSDLRWRAELTADPLWPRTSIINSLRIEYSTQVSLADDYEPDDTCITARSIAINGAAQAHTFHQQADADWAWFDATAGTTYVVETRNTGTTNTVIEPHRTCDAPPTASGRAFGPGYTISFTAPATGRTYLKVFNHDPAAFGANTSYVLSVRAVQPAAVAVIVAGHDNALSAQDNITYAADRAYRIFRNAGIPKANIRYLAPQASHDADGDGIDDVAGPPTVANVRDAVQDWPRQRGVALGVPFYLYLADHGLVDRFKADGDAAASQITATDLNLWLSNLEATSGADNINVIIDACYSGSFIDETAAGAASIAGRNRVVIASTTSDWQAFGPAGGQGLYFSNAFFSALENEQSLYASFLAARQAVEAQELLQRPWLDDNGDRRFDTSDGALASDRALKRVALGGLSPRIPWVRGDACTGQIQAKISDDSAQVSVQVEVFPPSYISPQPDGSGTTRIVSVPVVSLIDSDGDGIYTGTFAFTESGAYRLVAHAQDAEGNLALPVSGGAGAEPGGRLHLPLILRGQ